MKKLGLIILLVFLAIIISTIIGAAQSPDNIFTQVKIDTWGHFISFFFLTWLLHALFRIPLINTGICLSFYAAFSELGQYYLGYRNGEFLDFLANIIGIALFMAIRWGMIVYGRSTYKRWSKRKFN